jgi:hypothetical protein
MAEDQNSTIEQKTANTTKHFNSLPTANCFAGSQDLRGNRNLYSYEHEKFEKYKIFFKDFESYNKT